MTTPQPSRRGVLTSFVVALPLFLSGCGRDAGRRRTARATSLSAADDADVVLVSAAVADESALLSYSVRSGRAHPELASVVAPITARQRVHVRELTSVVTELPEPVPAGRPDVPGSRQAALTKLRRLVAAAEQARLDDSLAAESGLLARLLASASASHAATVESLRRTP